KEQILQAARETEASVNDNCAEARARWEQAPSGEIADMAGLQEELEQAQLTNREIDKRSRRRELESQGRMKRDEADGLTRAMDDREEQKRNAIAQAKMPVDGLTLGERT